MKWFLLTIAVALYGVAHRIWQRAHYRDVSREWVAEDNRRRDAFGYEGISFTGPFKR